jgi:hypothetical protein
MARINVVLLVSGRTTLYLSSGLAKIGGKVCFVDAGILLSSATNDNANKRLATSGCATKEALGLAAAAVLTGRVAAITPLRPVAGGPSAIRIYKHNRICQRVKIQVDAAIMADGINFGISPDIRN